MTDDVTFGAARSYRPGSWFAVFGTGASVLLPPSHKHRVAALWELVDDGAAFDEVLDALIASGLRDLPAFVLLSDGDDGEVRVVVRGAATVLLRQGDEEVEVSGTAGGTWVERTVTSVTAVAVTVEESAGVAADLPIGSGLVRVSRVDAPAVVAPAAVDDAAPADAPADVRADSAALDEVDEARQDGAYGAAAASLAAAPAVPAAVGPLGDTPDEGAATDEAELVEPVGTPEPAAPSFDKPAVGPVEPVETPEPVELVAEPQEEPAPEPPPYPFVDGPAEDATIVSPPVVTPPAPEAPSGETAAAADEPEAPLVEPDDGATSFSPVLSEAPPVEPDDGATSFAPVLPDARVAPPTPPAPPAPPFGLGDADEDDRTMAGFHLSSRPGMQADDAPSAPDYSGDDPLGVGPGQPEPDDSDTGALPAPPSWAAAAPPPPSWAPAAPAPAAGDGDEDAQTHDGMTRGGGAGFDPGQLAPPRGIPGQPPAPSVTARPVARLVFSSGETVDVDRAILVGRAPEARRFTSAEQPRLVTVPSPQQEISSTHLEVRPGSGVDHGSAIVTDMGSTNGTVLVQPGLPPEDLQPGIAVQLIPGAIIDLGDGLTIQVANP